MLTKISCKSFVRLILLAGLATLALAGHTAAPGAAAKNLVDQHANPGKASNKECLACHAQIATGVSLNRKIKTYHRLHLESKLTTPKECGGCHQTIDLRDGSAAALRKQVDPELCAGCHSGGLEGAKNLYSR